VISTVDDENPEYDIQHIYSTVRFFICSSSQACDTRNCKDGKSIKYRVSTKSGYIGFFTVYFICLGYFSSPYVYLFT